MFCIVFLVWNAILIFVSLNSFVIFLVSFPLYVKMAHFPFCCVSVFSLCFVLSFLSYLLFSSILFIVAISFLLASFVTG
jgi:hypothetical protein